MSRLVYVVAALAGACLTGCGEAPEPAPEVGERPNVFEPLTDSVDRVRAVEDTVLEQAEELRRRIEEAENGSAP